MKKNKDNQSQVKVNKELLNAFKRYVSVYSPSGNTHKISTLVFGDLASLNPDNIFTDYYGNLHAQFNCGEGATIHLNSHLDTAPRTQKNRTIKELGGIVYAYQKNKRAILGADDRAGVTAIFELLDQIVVIGIALPDFGLPAIVIFNRDRSAVTSLTFTLSLKPI